MKQINTINENKDEDIKLLVREIARIGSEVAAARGRKGNQIY